MGDLFRFRWQSFDPASGTKVAIGLIVMMVLTSVTGESWLATGLVAMLAWLANVPGSLGNRIVGLIAFAAGAILVTVVSGMIELMPWPNVILVSVVGLLSTLALSLGTRAFMVGWVLICWAIYAPFLVDGTSVQNCVLAILAGTVVVVALSALAASVMGDRGADAGSDDSAVGANRGFILAYAVTITLVLALTTWLGWNFLSTDATLIAGGAFFIIGFDAETTWIAGIARMLAVLTGTLLGLLISQIAGPGLVLDIVVVTACFLSFAAMRVHPGAFMFFFMVFIAIGWLGFESEKLNLTIWERLAGETAGVVIAMAAIGCLQWWHHRLSQ